MSTTKVPIFPRMAWCQFHPPPPKKTAAIFFFCSKNWRRHSPTHVKTIIADRKIIAAGEIYFWWNWPLFYVNQKVSPCIVRLRSVQSPSMNRLVVVKRPSGHNSQPTTNILNRNSHFVSLQCLFCYCCTFSVYVLLAYLEHRFSVFLPSWKLHALHCD